MDRVLDLVAADCPARRSTYEIHKSKWREGCQACLPDLDRPGPGDLPPGISGMQVIEGGRAEKPRTGVPKWQRNPRRSYDREGREIPPGTIAGLRVHGATHVVAYCDNGSFVGRTRCGHSARIDVSGWPDHVIIPDIGLRLRCSACGRKGKATVQPDYPKTPGMGVRME